MSAAARAELRVGTRRWLACGLAVLLLGVASSRASAGSIPCDCESCHGDHHGANWQGCSGCHDSPPASGSHLAHYDSAPQMTLTYGDVSVESTADAYKFGCGNCHPLDRAKHMDGSVEVELYDATSPAGSIKAKNPWNASYDPVTANCANVYCHSGYVVTSDAVGSRLTSPPSSIPPGSTLNNTRIMDPSCSNLSYDPYTVGTSRVYATTPPWGSIGVLGACTECHQFPLTTSAPTVSAGAGDSHQWIDDYGYANLHAWNMSYDSWGAVPCRTCHYDTVQQAGATRMTYPNGAERVEYDPVPIASRAKHVNGVPDVAFDTVDPILYRRSYSLSGAAYDPNTRTCADVACHYAPTLGSGARWQKNPQWGAPYRWWDSDECDLCHRYGSLNETCQPAP